MYKANQYKWLQCKESTQDKRTTGNNRSIYVYTLRYIYARRRYHLYLFIGIESTDNEGASDAWLGSIYFKAALIKQKDNIYTTCMLYIKSLWI